MITRGFCDGSNETKNFLSFFLLLMSMLATSCGQSTPDYTQAVEKTEVPVVTQTPFILIVTATNIPETLTEIPSLTSTPAAFIPLTSQLQLAGVT